MNTKLIFSILALLAITGCCCNNNRGQAVQYSAISTSRDVVSVREAPEIRWEETMHDTIEVQGQLDPTKTYYRAPHREVVEIRPGHHQNVTFSGDR